MGTGARRILRYTLRCPKSGVELRDVDRLKYIDPVPRVICPNRALKAINALPPSCLLASGGISYG
jgi:hypothetical protein